MWLHGNANHGMVRMRLIVVEIKDFFLIIDTSLVGDVVICFYVLHIVDYVKVKATVWIVDFVG